MVSEGEDASAQGGTGGAQRRARFCLIIACLFVCVASPWECLQTVIVCCLLVSIFGKHLPLDFYLHTHVRVPWLVRSWVRSTAWRPAWRVILTDCNSTACRHWDWLLVSSAIGRRGLEVLSVKICGGAASYSIQLSCSHVRYAVGLVRRSRLRFVCCDSAVRVIHGTRLHR